MFRKSTSQFDLQSQALTVTECNTKLMVLILKLIKNAVIEEKVIKNQWLYCSCKKSHS